MLERIGRLPAAAHWAILLGFCAVFFLIWPGHVPLTEADEARFTEATREMLESGNYMIPMCNYLPRYQKPILFYWMQAAAGKPFGLSETAARLPSALASIALVFLIYRFLMRRVATDERSRGAVLLSAAALATIPYVAIYARAAVTDATLTLWITATLICLLEADLRHAAAPDTRKRPMGLYLLAGVFGGLAFLTKGPMGIGIPALVWLAYHIRQRDLVEAAKRMPWVPVLAVFVIVAAPWYVGTYFYKGPGGGPDFLSHFFLKENVGRFSNTMQGHGSDNRLIGLAAYVAMTLVLAFPISILALREFISPFGRSRAVAAVSDLVRIRRFAMTWLLVVIGVFSLSKTVMPEYIQSIVGALGILFALQVVGRTSTEQKKPAPDAPRTGAWGRAIETALMTILGVIWTALPIYILLHPEKVVRGRVGALPFPETGSGVLIVLAAVFGLAFILGVTLLSRRRTEQKLIWMVAGWTALFAITILGVAPIYVRGAYSATGKLGAYLRTLPQSDTIICYCKESPESLVFYARRKIVFDERGTNDDAFRAHLNAAMERNGTAVVITDTDELGRIPQARPMKIIHRLKRARVLRIDAVKPVSTK